MTSWDAAVLNYLAEHTNQIVASLRDAVKLPSISGTAEENSIQAQLAGQLTEWDLDVDHWQIPLAETLSAEDFPGVEVERSEAWGLVGVLRGTGDGPSLMLNAHVDVVPPGDLSAWREADPFSGNADAHKVYGRGACDMKGGLIAAIWATRAISAMKVPLGGDLLLACVQGEEDGGLGTYATLARGWRADACVIPEPTSLDVVPANGGSLTFRLHVKGLASHASRRTAGVSAIEKFAPIFQALRRLEADRNRQVDDLMSRWDIAYPIEIGMVHAGDWSSSVPDLLIAEGRYGIALDESVDSARQEFGQAIAAVCADDAWLRDHPVQVQWWGGQFESGRTALDATIITTLRGAHSAASEHRQLTWGAPYGSDLRLMNGIGGVPTVQYGPGDVGVAHGPREFVPIAEVLTAARTLALLALRHCGTS